MSAGVPVLEIGGSHVTAAVVSPAGWDVEVVERAKLDSQRSADEIVAQLVAAAKQLPLASGLAVALPGPFDFATGIAWYRGVEKFDSLYGHDLGKSLRELLELDRVVFLNDAEAFSVGEWTAGELRGLDRCVGVTIGTGIGTGFLDDGRAVRTGDTVPPGGELYKVSYQGRPLEDRISARAILRSYFDRLGAEEPAIGVREIAERARGGEAVALEVLLDAFGVLSRALVPWLSRFGATRVVLGGSISGAFDIVSSVFPFDVAATEDTEHSALIGAAAQYVRSTGGN
ncbi:glucokinase [Kribbella orskensis]|uniref:Glucokinase n=1 Tax=Kribbella orskensis TaxID=2512216 RepID=A0ABY2BD15_9ACTN|nr:MULTISPECIES: ROK family protein [Kribbella]TCN35274.1 glucokinase [Kribbella sp. VKM Ac-2500]TCO16696.1 glucokinase [Kribbella orskensis]